MRIPGKLVVRTYAPARRFLTVAALVLGGALALAVAFEAGRRKAGFDGLQATKERVALDGRISELESQAHDMRVEIAAAQSAQIAQEGERAELARTIGELQAGLGRAQQDLDFYRGIANPQAAMHSASVRVQNFRVVMEDAEQRTFTLRIALNRPTRAEESTSGSLVLTIDGERNGANTTLDLAALTGGKANQISYSFRYYTNIEQAVSLPADFKPERTTIEIRPARKGVATYRQIFVWNPDSNQ